MKKVSVWRLKKGMDRRFRSGHPWVYSNELLESPKGHSPGELVCLQDPAGKFLAYGFGNPHSLIAFRTLSRTEDFEPTSAGAIAKKLIRAGEARKRLGFLNFSHRLSFGEADSLPGLVIDSFLTDQGRVLVIQAHTAGADLLLENGTLLEALGIYSRHFFKQSIEDVTIIVRNDLGVRKLEGLQSQDVRVLHLGRIKSEKELSRIQIKVRSAATVEPKSKSNNNGAILFEVDLLEGQKTGFFLDQFANIELTCTRLKDWAPDTIRILDLCCYVGQWSTQLGKAFQDLGKKVEVTLVDASASALEFAKKNVSQFGISVQTLKLDVLKELESLPTGKFDLVISDPPALIKGRKDLPTGSHAYLQLATQAIRLTSPEHGAIIACSCSSLFPEEDFLSVLQKAALRNQAQIKWVGRGAQSADHPILAEFPEGRYLKGWIGLRCP